MKNRGFMKVFKFSYEQSMKSKSTKISIAILVLVALLFLPIKTIVSGGLDEDVEKVQVESVYVKTENEALYNELVNMVNSKLDENAKFSMISDEQYDDTVKKLKADDSTDLYLEVYFNEDETSEEFGLSYKLVYGKGEKAEEIADTLDAILMENSKDMIIAYYGISEEVAKTLVPSEYDIKVFDADGNEVIEDKGLTNTEYWFTYGVIFVLIMMISFIGSMTAEGIVAEKANRVIEYIMITLKPMDLIIGKVLSAIATLYTMFGATILAFIVSTFINKALDSNAKNVVGIVSDFVAEGVLKGFNVVNVIIALLIVFAGSYFYSILGALSGGLVSKVEEMTEGLKIFMMLFMVGAYMAMFLAVTANSSGSDWGVASYLVYLLPISSMFIIPAYILLGKVSTVIAILAVAVAVIFAVLLTALASKIFGQMLYHNGSPLTIKDIISMTKEGKINEK